MNSSSKEIVDRVYAFLEKADLFVWDFSILMTMDNIQLINWLANMAIKNQKKILVSEEFYRCYSIVVKSSSAEQREIAVNTKSLLTLMKKHSALVSNSTYKTTASLIKALHTNPKVAFLISSNSEAAELLVASDDTQAMILAITQEGKLSCCDRGKLATLLNTQVNNDPNNKYVLSVKNHPKTGDLVKTADGNEFLLKKEISSGAEGTVYCTDDDAYVCKVFHEKQLSVLRCKKLKFFENRQVRYEGICWPEKIVYTHDGKPVGYIMQKAHGKEMSKIFDGEESILENFPDWTRVDLVNLSIRLLEKFVYLHLLGIKVGDIRPQNIVISDDGSVYLIDMDSCQIEDFPCPFGDEDFTPAENQGKAFDSFLRTYRNERFSIFVLIFTVLFLGAHPYAQKNGADTIAEEIYSHAFPYPLNHTDKCSKAPVGGYDVIWNITPQSICTLFFDCFKLDSRADIVELLMQLDSYRDELDSIHRRNAKELALGFDEDIDIYSNSLSNDSFDYNIDVSSVSYPSVNYDNDVNNYNNVGVNSSGNYSQNYVVQNVMPVSEPVVNLSDGPNKPQKKKSSVILWLIIVVCICLLVVFALISPRFTAIDFSFLSTYTISENIIRLCSGG